MWAAPSRSVLLSSSVFSPVLFNNMHSLSLEGPAANARADREAITHVSV